MSDENKNTPKAEPGGQQEPESKDSLEAIRSDVNELKDSLKAEVVDTFRSELSKLKGEKNDEKVPAPEIERKQPEYSGVKVTGEGTDPLYRSLPEHERRYRNSHVDRTAQRWLRSVANRDYETMRSLARKLNDMVRADEITEGTAATDGGIADGTGAPLIPRPLANTIAEVRNKRAKIRQRAQVYTSPNQTLTIPVGDVVTASMVDEGSTASNSAAGLSYVNLSKKKVQAKFELTMEFLADHNSAFNAVNYFVRRAGAAIGALEDIQFATGTGSSPNISRAFEGIQGETVVVPNNSGRLTYGDVNKLFYALGEQYRDGAVFAGNSNALQLLSALTDGDGRPVFNPVTMATQAFEDPVSGRSDALMRRGIWELPFTTSGTDDNLVDLWFFDPSEYAILDDGRMTVAMSEHAGFDNDTFKVKVTERIDGYPTVPQAFSRLVAFSGTQNGSTADTFI